MKLKIIVAAIMAVLFCQGSRSQDVAVKTNLLYDALLSPNLGVEVGLAAEMVARCVRKL